MTTFAQREYAKCQLSKVTSPGDRSLAETMDFYDSWAGKFDQHVAVMGDNLGSTMTQRVLQLYPERRDIRILDCGAGTGYVGGLLSQLGFKYMDGIDGSEAMLEKARKMGVYQRLIKEFHGPNRLPIEDNSYDLIVSIGLIAPNHAGEDCLAELIRVVKPGGKIYLSTREVNVMGDPHLSVHLEPAMERHQARGEWKRLSREIVPNYLAEWNGLVFIYEVL